MDEFTDLAPVVTEHEAGWAVFNWHSPAVEIDERGTYSHDGVHRIVAGGPLRVAGTREAAETWRRDVLAVNAKVSA